VNLRRAVVGAAALAAIVLVLVGAGTLLDRLGPGSGAPQLPTPDGGVALTTRTATRAAFFGDRVEASALVSADTRKVVPESLRLRGDFAPFTVAATHTVRRTSGPILTVRTTWELACLDTACLPGKTSHAFTWAPVALGYRLRGTRLQRALTEPFEPVTVLTRVTPTAVRRPSFRVAPPVIEAPRYRIAPRRLALLLALVGIALCAGALALAAYATIGLRGRRADPADPFALVLVELHRAARGNGDSARRRRALERLAELVEPDDPGLGGETRSLAWAPDDPPADAIDELARRAREART
jgi:hypothetical protein